MAERFGPFDAYLSDYDKMRRRDDVEDRRDEPWPWHPVSKEGDNYSQSIITRLKYLLGAQEMDEIPPVTKLGRDLGARDVEAPSDEELLKFIIGNDATQPYPEGPWVPPIPRPRPKGVK